MKWNWTAEREKAFCQSKELLLSDKVGLLVHFNPNVDLILACDDSYYGIGSVLSHKFPNGDEKPIAYASYTLTESERGYYQLEKEALSILFSIKHFHQYFYIKHFILKTDHKPLTFIFGPTDGISQMTANRLQRWATIFLAKYDYAIHYVRSKDNGNADGLYRLPIMKGTANLDKEVLVKPEFTNLNFVKYNMPCFLLCSTGNCKRCFTKPSERIL